MDVDPNRQHFLCQKSQRRHIDMCITYCQHVEFLTLHLPFFASEGWNFRFRDYFWLVARCTVHACARYSYTLSSAHIKGPKWLHGVGDTQAAGQYDGYSTSTLDHWESFLHCLFIDSRLLDVIAARKNSHGLSGRVLVDSAKQPQNFKCISGYVIQVHTIEHQIICYKFSRFSQGEEQIQRHYM